MPFDYRCTKRARCCPSYYKLRSVKISHLERSDARRSRKDRKILYILDIEQLISSILSKICRGAVVSQKLHAGIIIFIRRNYICEAPEHDDYIYQTLRVEFRRVEQANVQNAVLPSARRKKKNEEKNRASLCNPP